jgi:hypothetical protein
MHRTAALIETRKTMFHQCTGLDMPATNVWLQERVKELAALGTIIARLEAEPSDDYMAGAGATALLPTPTDPSSWERHVTGRQIPAALAEATRRRSEDAKKRTRRALKRLRTNGVAVTFRTVAAEAGVSRDFLYRNPDMRALVVDARATTTSMPALAPSTRDSNITRLMRDRHTAELARRTAEVADLSRRLEAAHTEIHRLKRELRRAQPRLRQSHAFDD